MLDLKASTIAFLLPLLLSPIFAEDVKLVGCDDVGCPSNRGTDRCRVEDITHFGVGVSPIPNVPSELEGFSLIKGVNNSITPIQVNGSQEYPFRSFYYLGTPANTEANELSGCAIIFNNPPSKLFEYPKEGGRTDTLAATGICSDVIEQSCIDTITQRARDTANDNTDRNACNALEQELQKDDFSECSSFGGQGTSLGNFTIKSIGDLHNIRNSSDCWPVQQKSDNLLQIAEVISNGSSSRREDIYREAYKITPVLTVFVGGNNSLVNSTSSQMTCLKLVYHDQDPEEDGSGGSASAAAALGGSWLITTVAVLVGILTAL
ncbi:hypothetical protein FQN49_002697 [Arthroderma sp. PD_2]|nr:hypothetical protein FQN49_002697 [Arthroderma sp. PD_2]